MALSVDQAAFGVTVSSGVLVIGAAIGASKAVSTASLVAFSALAVLAFSVAATGSVTWFNKPTTSREYMKLLASNLPVAISGTVNYIAASLFQAIVQGVSQGVREGIRQAFRR